MGRRKKKGRLGTGSGDRPELPIKFRDRRAERLLARLIRIHEEEGPEAARRALVALLRRKGPR